MKTEKLTVRTWFITEKKKTWEGKLRNLYHFKVLLENESVTLEAIYVKM